MSKLVEKIYEVVKDIPRGKVATYKQIATLAGNPRASRVVGYAMKHNTDMSIIPCHRVVGSNGKMVGYSAHKGVSSKIQMLKDEGVIFKNNDMVSLKKSKWETTHEYSPLVFLTDAKDWLRLYEIGIKDKSLQNKFVPLYCLFQSLELYLKSYLILKQKWLANEYSMKQVYGHKIWKLRDRINKISSQEIKDLINEIYDNFILNVKIDGNKKEYEFTNLRYIKIHSYISLRHSLYEDKIETFKHLFRIIQNEVEIGMRNGWLD